MGAWEQQRNAVSGGDADRFQTSLQIGRSGCMMRAMKRETVLLLAVMLLPFSLMACGDGPDPAAAKDEPGPFTFDPTTGRWTYGPPVDSPSISLIDEPDISVVFIDPLPGDGYGEGMSQ